MTIELDSKVEKSVVSRSAPFYPQVVGEVIKYQQGSLTIRDLYLRGWWSKLGTLTNGLTGKETIVREQTIVPVRTFTVNESNNGSKPR